MRSFITTAVNPEAKVQPVPQLESPSPQETLRWAVETFGPNLVMTSAFGLGGVALIHMLQTITRDVPVIFVDTGQLFEETLETKRRIELIYGIQVLTYHPLPSAKGRAYPHHPDLCCTLRKIEPMQRAMADLKPSAVLNARARFQASTRQYLPVVEWIQTPIRVNPLALWSQEQIFSYVKLNDVPYNPLYDRGYPSVGCWPCTQPVAQGQSVRAGRWTGVGKTECGLWTRSGQKCGVFIDNTPRREMA